MSRRKQTKPRHLDDTGDLGDSLANVMTEPSNSTDMNGLDEVGAADRQEGPDELSEVSEIIPSVSGSRLTPTDTDSISPVQGANEPTDENLNEEVVDDELKEDYRGAKYEGEADSRYQSPSHELEHEQDVNIEGTGSNEGLLNEEGDAEVMDMDEDDEDDDDDDDDDDEIQEMPQMPFFPGAAAMLPHLFSGSNVKLEQLRGTKVAVAQFAENNMAPSEFAMLQSALFTLHQQQLLQLQMLQQIQHHLMSGASGIVPVMSSSSTLASLPSTTVFTTAVATTSQLNQTTSDANKENRTPHNGHHRIADTVLTPSGQLKRSASHLDMPEAPSPLLPPTGTPLGQDSGSNIFNKSERPYKCNVCGNRFSTKGNLKVHFQRHKEKYPHIMMNPNPTPEHLEHQPQMPPPLIPGHSSTPLGTPLMSPSHPSPGMKMPHETPLTPNIPMPTPKIDDRHQDRDHIERERVSQMPLTPVQTSPSPPKVETPASSSSDAAPGPLSKPASAAPSDSSSSPVSSALTPLSAMSNMMASTPPMPLPGTFPGLVPPFSSPFGFEPPFMRGSILPQKTEDPMEQYMEIDKSSETRKLEQLVKNIESKLSDPNECAICHRILSCKSALQMHYRTHTGERPFKCKICGRAFTTKGNLKTHMGVHRAKPPLRMMHQCPVCHKQFTNALVLQQHIRMHTSDIPTELKLQNEMMAAATMGFMRPPYPGMPPMPIPMPPGMGPPQHQIPTMPGGELDLRKPPVDMMRHPMTSDKSPPTDHEESHHGDNHGYEKEDPEDDPEMQGYENEALNGEHEEFKDNEDEEEFLRQREDEEFSKHEEQDNTEQTVKEENQVAQEENDAMDTDHQDGEKSHDEPPVLSSPSHADDKMETSMDRSESVPVRREEEQPPKEYVDPTSKYMSDYSNYLNTPSSDSQTPLYSTSLMALEERVKAIEHMAATPSFHSQLYGNPYQQHSSTSPNMVPGLSREGTPTRASLSGGSEERTTPLSKGGTPNPVDGSINMNSSESMDGEGSNLSGYRGFGGLEYGSRPFEMVTGRMNTTCNVCYKTFACKSALDIHYRSHTKERPFKCDVCDRGFSTRGNMRQHMLTHKIRDLPNQSVPSGDPGTALPPSLPVKTESSPPRPSVSVTTPPVHVTSAPLAPVPAVMPPVPVSTTPSPPASNPALSPRSTTKPALDTSPFVRKPKLNHVCQMCQKPFSSASALQIHIRTHTGDKPFKCTVCGKAFTTKGNLKVHMGTHMWNNSPSRRGRRMSVDLAALTSPAKDPDYYRRFAHQPPEMYPFPFSPYANGYSPKMNEIPVIQNLNGGLNRMPPPPVSMGDMMPSPYSMSMADNGHPRKSPTYPTSMSDTNHTNKSPPAPVDTKPTPTKTSPSEAASYPVPASYLPMVNPYNNNNNKVRTAPNGELDLSIKKVATPPSSGDSPPEPQEAPGATWPWMPPPAVEPSTSKPLMA